VFEPQNAQLLTCIFHIDLLLSSIVKLYQILTVISLNMTKQLTSTILFSLENGYVRLRGPTVVCARDGRIRY